MIEQGRKADPESQVAKHGKNCKACGTWFVNRDRFYCSPECRKSVVAKPVEFTCSNCGRKSTRNPHKIKNPKRIFCNKECQNKFQKANYAVYQNTVAKPVSKTKTNIAKSKWYTKCRDERRKNSIAGGWWLKCVKCKSRADQYLKQSAWDRRCYSAVKMIKERREPVFALQRSRGFTWDKTIKQNKKRLRVDNRPKDEIEWSTKINYSVRACKRRFLAKNKSDTGCFGTNIMETRLGLLPFAE